MRLRLLCDADGCLFPSEEPAYDASAEVMAQFLAHVGIARSYSATQLRTEFTGLNFRATAAILCGRHGRAVTAGELARWVALERDVVTRHLSRVLTPDPAVLAPLSQVGAAAVLSVVSSSASARIDACLAATGLAALFPHHRRFSAEALRPPASKPDPAVYVEAVSRIDDADAPVLAVEDSGVGVQAAVAAGVPVVGLLQFVRAAERERRTAQLLRAGACAVVESWEQLVARQVTGRADPGVRSRQP
ncbi:HAD-IA family hydrolase [Nocardioides sp. R1-1]|uniref:HAD-IA family hydrolase n=1 Tax=Nocardioides sp. R1-1 TaxID=3383502 RepID=UPI0038CF49E8